MTNTGPGALAALNEDPLAEARWAEQTIAEAEDDSVEHQMANDILPGRRPAQPAPAKAKPESQPAPKTAPKSFSGLFYAAKGLMESVLQKISGK